MNPASSSKNSFALAAVCLSALMLGLEITSIPSILPTLESVLPADFRQLQWIMNAYTIAMCAVLMAMGALGDRFGRKRIFMSGVVVFGIASLICGLATSAPLLIAARFLQDLAQPPCSPVRSRSCHTSSGMEQNAARRSAGGASSSGSALASARWSVAGSSRWQAGNGCF